ncbi:solute carrier family 41 member 3-like isoform X2 [Ornithodoros turicata]|uniref:solute carrier family 41 member 3-like isoform X2 n=1 Tax=Ornithodoros turicata TaxID=34597 RepID=UPI003139FCA6
MTSVPETVESSSAKVQEPSASDLAPASSDVPIEQKDVHAAEAGTLGVTGGVVVQALTQPGPKRSIGAVSIGGVSIGHPSLRHTANAATGTSNQLTEVTLGEHLSTTAIQVFIPFLLAGFGSVLAGIVLDLVKNITVFVVVRELFILIPPLLGLNGNLEQTLVARLATQANLGKLDRLQDQIPTVFANMALLQCQATVASTIACLLAVFKGVVFNSDFRVADAGIIFGGALAAVNLASFILCTVMCTVVILSKKCGRNPDEVAPAIAASFGDLVTLSLFSLCCTLMFYHKVLIVVVTIICYLALPLWVFLARRNPMTTEVLRVGWFPLIVALCESSFGGYILDYSVQRFPGIALHLSSVNAIGGNIAAIFSCTMSTYLNKAVSPGVLPRREPICPGPYSAFFSNKNTGTIAIVLFSIVIPGQIIIATTLKLFRFGHVSMSLKFTFFYVAASLGQVTILLYLARVLVYFLWKNKIDPDNAAIPFLTGAGDFVGTGFLTLAFIILEAMNDPSVTEGDPEVTSIAAVTTLVTSGDHT